MKNLRQTEFAKLIDPEKYQVFLLTCPAHVPFNAFAHPWFVINNKGTISRWEVRYKKNKKTGEHVYPNNLSPFQGIEVFSFSKRLHWKATLVAWIEGGENSLAQKITEFIARSNKAYPDRARYSLFGPNSDTYAQWVLNNFPEWKISLPHNTVGKNYKTKKVTVGVIHGRFQPPHNGHIRYIRAALERAEQVIIGICTPEICTPEEAAKTGYPCTAALNPFSFEERKDMIELALVEANVDKERYTIIPFPSDYRNIEVLVPKNAVFLLSVTGTSDERKAEYLKSRGFRVKTLFSIPEGEERERSRTIRDNAGSGKIDWEENVPKSVASYIKKNRLTQKLITGDTMLK